MQRLPSPGKWSLQTFKLLCFCISWWYPHFLQDPHSQHELHVWQVLQHVLQQKPLPLKERNVNRHSFLPGYITEKWPSYGPVSNWQAHSFHPRLVYPLVIYPQLNGRTERTKQEPEAAVRCVVSSISARLYWVWKQWDPDLICQRPFTVWIILELPTTSLTKHWR